MSQGVITPIRAGGPLPVVEASEPSPSAVTQVYGQRRRHGFGWLGTPVLVVLVGGALAVYLASIHRDFVEKQVLTTSNILTLLRQHVELTAASTLLVVAIAVPAGVLLTRPRLKVVRPPVLAVANIGQAIPSIGLLVLLAIVINYGFRPAVIALVAYSLLPVLRNTMVGLESVDPSLLEAGRGVGLSRRGILWRIELPLAVPVMLAGIRTAVILDVGTATLATYTNGGGLGSLINVGITESRTPVLLAGAVLTALLALLCDWIAEVAEMFLTPQGL